MKNMQIEKMASIFTQIGYEEEMAVIIAEKEAMAKEANAMWNKAKGIGKNFLNDLSGSNVKRLADEKNGLTSMLKTEVNAHKGLIASGAAPNVSMNNVTDRYKSLYKDNYNAMVDAKYKRDFARITAGTALGGIGVGAAMAGKNKER